MALTVTHALVSAIADDPVAAAAGEVVPSDWNADHTISVTSLTIATGTITASEPVLDLSQTWNAGGVTFVGAQFDITDTASANSSIGLVVKRSGTANFAVAKNTNLFPATQMGVGCFGIYNLANAATGIVWNGTAIDFYCGAGKVGYVAGAGFVLTGGNFYLLSDAKSFQMGASSDIIFERDAAATLALRNSTNAQTLRVYGTYTDSSNYVRASLSSSSTAVTLAAETAGTGADDVDINLTPAGAGSVVISNGTLTADAPLLDLAQTWNAGAVTFTGIKLNVTNTASASGSKLLDLQVGGVSKAFVLSTGAMSVYAGTAALPGLVFSDDASTGFYKSTGTIIDVAIGGTQSFRFSANGLYFPVSTGTFGLSSAGRLGWESGIAGNGAPDVALYRDAAATLALRDGTNAQTFRVYGTYTDSSNYVRASLSSSSTAVTLAAETAGTGADNVPVNITPAGTEGVQFTNFAQLTEMTAPAAGAANTARIYAVDNGGGKTQLMVIFASGAAQQIAIEP